MSKNSAAKLSEITWHGFAAFRLENSLVTVDVVPALGGKIASLLYKPSNREWLWSNPYLAVTKPVYGDSYTAEFDLGGWDECFPSVAPTRYPQSPWLGAEIADHGELWSQEWQTEKIIENGTVALKMTAGGVNIPYRFVRTISLSQEASAISLDYLVENLAESAIAFLWCAHPTFQVEPGMKLNAPLKEMTVFSSVEDRFGKLGDRQTWPILSECYNTESHKNQKDCFDLSTLPAAGASIAAKLYGRAPAEGQVSLEDPQSGDKLEFSFDPNKITHLGLWLNFNGWSGLGQGKTYYNLAIEPGIGAQDDLELACRFFHEYGELPARESLSWSLSVNLSGESMSEDGEHEDEMCIETELKEDGRILTYYHFRKAQVDASSEAQTTKSGSDRPASLDKTGTGSQTSAEGK